MRNQEVEKIFSNALDEAMKNASTEVVASMQKFGLNNVQKMANARIVVNNQIMPIGSASKVMEAFNTKSLRNAGKIQNLNQSQNIGLGLVIGNVISQTAAANNSVMLNKKGPKIDP